jgi:CheY-like chemotaxis protein
MKILIVEDMEELRWAISERFKSFGFEIVVAENGEEALKALETLSPVFVLTDIQMPKMNGIEFLKQARAKFPTLPILVMTGFSPYTEQEVLGFGANGYYEKTQMDVAEIARKFFRRSA